MRVTGYNITLAGAAALLAGALPTLVHAQVTGLEDMVGARAGQAEAELQRRGYRNIRGEKGDDRSYTYWWNADRRQCVSIATMNGRYDSITPTTAPDCRQSASAPAQPGSGWQSSGRDRPGQGYPGDTTWDQRDGNAINLLCVGQGERLTSEYTNSLEWDRYDHKYRPRDGVTTQMRGFESAVTVQIYGQDGRIRLPKKLVPPIHSGGDHQDWWQLNDISVGEGVIQARYRLNGLNSPKVRIDRTTGQITIKGTGQDFFGMCQKIDPGQRRF